ncbi:MAG: glycosyltransferase family 2 protein [Saprospiraceae bacterium]|nr:glycosyltransferase family 2 protein [Saprospiraceae bacterium]
MSDSSAREIRLSVAIITYNEEENIGRCLASVQDIADEIVVVDSFSTDKTEEICRSFGVRFIQHTFEGHVEQKNVALDSTTHEYVLSLDADEALSDALRRSIVQVKSDFVHDGYSFNRLTNYAGQWIRHCGWYPDRKLRLWRKSQGRWGGDNPHDKVIMRDGATTAHLTGDLLHYSYRDLAHHIQKMDYLTTISARVAFENGKRASLARILMALPFNFLRDYIIKGGFRDGYYGLLICYNGGYSKFLKYAKLRLLWREARENQA